MRRRAPSGWRRWALGAGSGAILSITFGFGAAVVTQAAGTPGVQVSLPSLPIPTPIPSLPVSTSGLPLLGGPTPPVCIENVTCPATGDKNPDDNNDGNNQNTRTATGPSNPAGASAPVAAASADPSAGAASAALTRLHAGVRRETISTGLNLGPPPSVLALGPASSISFGKAPFLWPLFAGLDVLGLGAVVWVVRKTWSRSPAD